MKVRKVLFVRPSIYTDDGRLAKANRWIDRLVRTDLAEMALPLLAAYTPDHIECEIVDDCVNEVDFDTDANVVALTAWLVQKDRAIDLAKEFKKRGKIVVIGGYLATSHPELLEDCVDSICIGEGDLIWPKMLDDIENDCLLPRYEADFKMPLDRIPTPRYDLIQRSWNTHYPVQATRGCPYNCSYCSIVAFYRHTYRHRPVEHIVRDIKAHGSRVMHFVDDNLFDNRVFAKELFLEMAKGRRVYWGVQATINVADDSELLALAFKAGCRVVIVGMESVCQSNLQDVDKTWAKARDYKDKIRKIQEAGIGVHALIIFGMQNDTERTFKDTVDFLLDAGCTAAEFFILTPYLHTRLGKQMLAEGRITDHDLSHYREPHVVFQHPTLTAAQIQRGYWWAFREFYSLKNNIKRLWKSNLRNRAFQILQNMYYWTKLKRDIVPTHSQRYTYAKIPDAAVDDRNRAS